MKKFLSPIFLSMLILLSLTSSAFATTVGDKLSQPETGWTRYDDTHPGIKYEGTWSTFAQGSNSQYFWLNSHHVTTKVGATATFSFTGSKIRFVSNYIDRNSSDVQFTIDGISEHVSEKGSSGPGNSANYLNIVYEKTNLVDGNHTIEIKNFNSGELLIDAIDIDGVILDSILPVDPTPTPTPTPSETATPEPSISPEPTPSPSPSPSPGVPSGDRAILTITLTTGLEKEFDLPISEVNSFLNWYDSASGSARYGINKHDNNKGPFSKRTDYVIFDKILTFEVSEYTAD